MKIIQSWSFIIMFFKIVDLQFTKMTIRLLNLRVIIIKCRAETLRKRDVLFCELL